MINISEFVQKLHKDPIRTRFELIREAEDLLASWHNSDADSIDELLAPNYSEICDALGWPDFQDGGIFEQCIDAALNTMLACNGCKPAHLLK